MTVSVRIVTSGGIIWECIAQSVILPSSEGKIGILRGHIPLTTGLKIGILRILVNWQWLILFVLESFTGVRGNDVTVLANAAEWGDLIDIQLQLAQAELEAAEVSLKQSQAKGEKLLATKAVKMAQTRLKAAQEFHLVGKG